jgi:hypothetical protein
VRQKELVQPSSRFVLASIVREQIIVKIDIQQIMNQCAEKDGFHYRVIELQQENHEKEPDVMEYQENHL